MASGGGRDRENQNYWAQQSQTAYQNAAQPSALQSAFEQAQLDFLNWDKSSGKNVAEAPGLDNYIQIGRAAMERADRDRQGTGALALGADGSAGYAPLLKELRKSQEGERFGTGLEETLAARRAEATGSVLPLANLDLARKQGQSNFAGGMLQRYMYRPRTGFLNSFSNAFGGALGQGLGHTLGGGFIGAGGG